MKRQKASTKMTNIVHEGWMIKSPPERKLNRSTPFKIFRAQWKKRYFVLRKPSGSLPDQYELHYFKDDKCSCKKGSIDLEQCEKIIESLDSDQFQYLFTIKTVCKNKVRNYYLAADSQQEMSTWVQWLCHVCGLKQEEQPTDIPDPRPQPSLASNGVSSTSPHHTPLGSTAGATAVPTTAQPGSTSSSTGHGIGTSPASQASVPVPIARAPTPESSLSSSSSPSYIPLETCTSGRPQSIERKGSSESLPEFTAPPIPQRNQDDDDVFVTSGLYQRPPPPVETSSRADVVSDVYKVPPIRPARPVRPTTAAADQDEEEDRNECYDIPPPRRDSPTRGKTRTNSATSGGVPSECYDYPPPRHDSTTSSDGGDHPPERPERPPRPGYMQSPYQNLPPAGKSSTDSPVPDLNTVLAAPRVHKPSLKIDYDVPPSHHRTVPTNPLNAVAPPPPKPHKSSSDDASNPHTYLNTRPISGEVIPASKDDEPSLTPPAIPPPRYGSLGEPADGGRSNSPHSLLYQTPPSSSSSSASSNPMVPPARPPARAPPKIPGASPNANDSRQEDGGAIFSTSRTRSFKKQHNINNNMRSAGQANTLPMNTSVPRPHFPSRTREFSTSEEEDEATHHPLSLLHHVPTPTDHDRELKYIDLALPEAAQDAPRPSHHGHAHGHTHSHGHHGDRSKDSTTEYREIDFVKTQALSDAKRVKEKERKSDDHI